MSVKLWETVQEEEPLREINAAQEAFNKKEDLNKAAQKAAEMLANDQPITKSQMEGLLKIQINKEIKKQRVTWAKTSLAGSKNQGSATERSGPKSNSH